ncbi:MAG: glycosyltransferase [Deltaproteobacteria bacterium]|nr:glycosyltransferase [Deltaproteobacteria bacterium]
MYYTALRPYTLKRLEEIGRADVLVGIPAYNNERTIAHVIQMVSHGLDKYYKEHKNVIMIADGGSTDDTREMVKEFQLKPWQEKLLSIYRGPGGKGTAFRSIFEAAVKLNVKACIVVDSDIRSITSDWVHHLLSPVLEKGYHYVTPVYCRYKYDGTITNNIVYNLTRALYGKRIRQPIGGDFAFSQEVASYYIDQPVWDTEIARFGIDIWMTTQAVVQGFKICQANLGVKVHDAKDPAAHLGPMFRQVVWTIFYLMEQNESYWKKIKKSTPVETFGAEKCSEPEPIKVDLDGLIYNFQVGFKQFGSFWKDILDSDSYSDLKKATRMSAKDFSLPVETWVRILYELAATFHYWPMNRNKLVDLMTPLYYARVASFVRETWDMDSSRAEDIVEKNAEAFEEQKGYLLKMWDKKRKVYEKLSERA